MPPVTTRVRASAPHRREPRLEAVGRRPVVALLVLVRADDGEVRVELDLDLAAVVEVDLDLVAALLVLDLAVDDRAAAGLGESGLAGLLQRVPVRATSGPVGRGPSGRAGDARSGDPGDDERPWRR